METENIREALRRKAFNDIMSHKYFIKGHCFNCGEEYARCTNKKKSNKDLYCCDDCWKEHKQKRAIRNKEKYHYEVYKDNEFYYIVVNGEFNEKRNFEGKTWMKKLEQDREKQEDVLKVVMKWKQPILAESSKIPENAIKIIDKISPYLYDEKHPFRVWAKLKRLSERTQ